MTFREDRQVQVEIKPASALFVIAMACLARFDIATLCLLVGSVLAHEAAHLIMAQRFGIRVKAVGMALWGPYLRRSSAIGAPEAITALAGPIASLALALSTTGVLSLFNWSMFVVNMLPLPGSDGMHAIRALAPSKAEPPPA